MFSLLDLLIFACNSGEVGCCLEPVELEPSKLALQLRSQGRGAGEGGTRQAILLPSGSPFSAGECFTVKLAPLSKPIGWFHLCKNYVKSSSWRQYT